MHGEHGLVFTPLWTKWELQKTNTEKWSWQNFHRLITFFSRFKKKPKNWKFASQGFRTCKIFTNWPLGDNLSLMYHNSITPHPIKFYKLYYHANLILWKCWFLFSPGELKLIFSSGSPPLLVPVEQANTSSSLHRKAVEPGERGSTSRVACRASSLWGNETWLTSYKFMTRKIKKKLENK